MQEIRVRGSLRSFLESSRKTFLSHSKSLSKVSRKRFHVFLLNTPIFRARKWARNFNSDNYLVLSEDPENGRETFRPAKLVLVSVDWLKVQKASRSQASLTMQKIILEQTDSEIYFDVGYNKKETAW